MFNKEIKNKKEKVTEYLLYIFVFLIPWQTRYIYKYLILKGELFEYGKLAFYFSELVLILLIVFAIIFFRSKKFNKIYLIPFALLAVSLLGYFTALNYEMYFYGLGKLIELVLLFLIISRLKFSFLKVFVSFIFSIFIQALIALGQFFSQTITANKYLGIAGQFAGQGGPSVLEGSFGRWLRAYGGFSHPNILGGFIVIAILFLIALYLQNKKSKCNFLFWMALIILFQALVFSFSRSAGLALILSLVFLFFYLYRQKKLAKIWPILGVLILITAINFVFFQDLIQSRLNGEDRLEIKSRQERQVLEVHAKELLGSNFIFGYGINNYIPAVFNRVDNNLNVWQYQPAHNIYLLVLIELGILGFLIYFSFIFHVLLLALKSRQILKFILGLSLIVILFISFFDHYFYTYWSGLAIIFLIIGLINKKIED